MAFLNEKKNSTVNEKLLSSMIPHTVIRSIPEPNFEESNKFHTIFLIVNVLNKETEAFKNPAIIQSDSHPLASY